MIFLLPVILITLLLGINSDLLEQGYIFAIMFLILLLRATIELRNKYF